MELIRLAEPIVRLKKAYQLRGPFEIFTEAEAKLDIGMYYYHLLEQVLWVQNISQQIIDWTVLPYTGNKDTPKFCSCSDLPKRCPCYHYEPVVFNLNMLFLSSDESSSSEESDLTPLLAWNWASEAGSSQHLFPSEAQAEALVEVESEVWVLDSCRYGSSKYIWLVIFGRVHAGVKGSPSLGLQIPKADDDTGVQEPHVAVNLDSDESDNDPYLDALYLNNAEDSDSDFAKSPRCLKDDPLFIPMDDLFNNLDDAMMTQTLAEQLDIVPSTFYEDPLLRNIYLSTFLDSVMNHTTHESVRLQLEHEHRTIATLVESEQVGTSQVSGKLREFQHWCSPQDAPGHIPPDWQKRFDVFPNRNCVLNDIYNGWAWCATQASLSRERGGEWEIDIGLPMKTNKFTGQYSCNVMYLTILNNPNGKQFLREETILICTIPGPTEPSLK
ncbi:hypothetical protein BDY19DRAFT_909442 [Irpex rosettiformis]|uniref:Uncharacterized protein n=1 Tax=Irpex rosettiformis TaxID=378272 RepID=A0ACB8TSL3_9APHY|nr:hypothetical protein BDY19DRAFT_909442 [Irpex rosettiformis]